MIYTKRCPNCKKPFKTRRKNQVFCGRKCFCRGQVATSEKNKKTKRQGQICWYCKKCCGECSWSRDLTPIEGWTAKKTKTEGGSYRISKCPQFEEDDNNGI